MDVSAELFRKHDLQDVSLVIHPADEMLESSVRLARGSLVHGRYLYFQTALEIATAQLQLVAPRLGEQGTLLDFASGYGRVTRIFARCLSPQRVWVSDVDPDAVAFQTQTFGLHGFVSSFDPSELIQQRRFDAILVTSLFTHLPQRRFEQWLRRICELLAPGGWLVFSTLDPSFRHNASPDERETLRKDGLLFAPESESSYLPTAEYGTTWVTEEYVERVLHDIRPDLDAERLPRGLCNYQDLWIARPRDAVSWPASTRFQAQPEVFIQNLCIQGRRLSARGWVLRRWGAPIVHVRLAVGGQEVASAPIDEARPDVAAIFGEAHLQSGWHIDVELQEQIEDLDELPAAWLSLEGIDENGVATDLWGGSVSSTLLTIRDSQIAWLERTLEETRRELAQVQQRPGEAGP